MAEPVRRRRAAISCTVCRRKKLGCNKETPCNNCVRSGKEPCVYEKFPSSRPRQSNVRPRTPSELLPLSRDDTIPTNPSNSVPTRSGNAVAPSEERSWRTIPYSNPTPISTAEFETCTRSPRLSSTLRVNRESHRPETIAHGVSHKTRLYGQSHWINVISLFEHIAGIVEPVMREPTSKTFAEMEKCKSLARIIKVQRTLSCASPAGADLPSRDVADKLVDSYLRTSESVYRILHVPAFRKDYDALWASNVDPESAFLVQLKLVLAIGAVTYDEKFSLRASAIRWVYAARTWLSEPKSKPRDGIQSLQVSLLLLIAQETGDIGGSQVWVAAGTLLREAMQIGLHRDPELLPNTSLFASEMRRRLWNTILELNLQSSITSGGSPLVSQADFDTAAPRNFEDDQLLEDEPVPKPESEFTQVSIAIALRRTFPLRLTIVKFLNDLGSKVTYEEALRLDAVLRKAYKDLRRNFQAYNSNDAPSHSQFQVLAIDFVMNRYLLALHVPFFGMALQETAYAHSKKVVVDTALKMWCIAYPSSFSMVAQSRDDMAFSGRNDFARFTICGAGFFRLAAMHAALLVGVELRTQLREDESMGPTPLRPDLLSVVNEIKTMNLRCIEAGECNIKGYLFVCVVAAEIDGLRQGLEENEIEELLIQAAEDSEETCLPLLRELAANGRAEGSRSTADLHDQSALISPQETVDDWNPMVSDEMFNTEDADLVDWVWMFGDETTQGLSFW